MNLVVVSFDKIDNTADKVNRRKYELNSIIYLKCLRFFLNLMNLLIIHAFNSLERECVILLKRARRVAYYLICGKGLFGAFRSSKTFEN